MKFSIRDLLWLMLVVGLSAGWWNDRTRLTQQVGLARSEHAVTVARLQDERDKVAILQDEIYDLKDLKRVFLDGRNE